MAYVQTASAPAGNIFSAFFNAILDGLVRIAEADKRVQKAQKLQSLSDEQLTKLGLTREQIPHYVFGDMMYL